MELIDFEAVVDDIDKLELDYEEDTDKFFFWQQPIGAGYIFIFLQKISQPDAWNFWYVESQERRQM